MFLNFTTWSKPECCIHHYFSVPFVLSFNFTILPGVTEINELGLWGNYSIPKENPFIADKELEPEIWALGFKDPWRCSDSERPSYFLCGDCGQVRKYIFSLLLYVRPCFIIKLLCMFSLTSDFQTNKFSIHGVSYSLIFIHTLCTPFLFLDFDGLIPSISLMDYVIQAIPTILMNSSKYY